MSARRPVPLPCVAVLASALLPVAASAQFDDPLQELEHGIDQVMRGEDQAATETLADVVRWLHDEPEFEKERPRAYLYLGIAWAHLGKLGLATGNFVEALALDWELKPDPKLVDDDVRRAFDDARTEARKTGRAPPGAASKGLRTLGFVGGAAGVGVAAAVLTRGSSPPPRYRLELTILRLTDAGDCVALDGPAPAKVVVTPSTPDYAEGTRVEIYTVPPGLAAVWGGACAPWGAGQTCFLRMTADMSATVCLQEPNAR